MHDKFDSKLSAANPTTLATTKGMLAIVFGRGSANAEAVIPIVAENAVPVISWTGGSLAMRSRLKRYFFNVRPPYRLEVDRAIGQLVAQGASKIATVYTDDAFGKDALEGFKDGLEAVKQDAAAMVSMPRGDLTVDDAVEKIVAPKAYAVIGIFINNKHQCR